MRVCNICNTDTTLEKLETIQLTLPSCINLNNTIDIKKCKECYFYFSDSNNTQDCYNKYYLQFNNYPNYVITNEKDQKCYDFLLANLHKSDKILDYGCGNRELVNKLKTNFEVADGYDIGMTKPDKKYNTIILAHVLEHIYDINDFIKKVEELFDTSSSCNKIYVEIPNAEYYKLMTSICPLQEINLEHINFFTKFALNKLMIKHNFCCQMLIDDYFTINNEKYYVIRGIFTKNTNNLSFENYLSDGSMTIQSFHFDVINKCNNIYVYGCGQLLFKILKYINTQIINIVDDNICYSGKDINNINIINYDEFKNKVKDDDNILITTLMSFDKIKSKLEIINKKINIIKL